MHGEIADPPAANRDARPWPNGSCRRCAGTGIETYTDAGEAVTCTRCEGHGDLDGYRLSGAWLQGYERARTEALAAMHEALGCLRSGLEQLELAPAPPPDVIRARLGG